MAAHIQHAQQGRLLLCVTFALIYRCQVIKKRMNTYRKEERTDNTNSYKYHVKSRIISHC